MRLIVDRNYSWHDWTENNQAWFFGSFLFHVVICSLIVFSFLVTAFQFVKFHSANAVYINVIQRSTPKNRDIVFIVLFLLMFRLLPFYLCSESILAAPHKSHSKSKS